MCFGKKKKISSEEDRLEELIKELRRKPVEIGNSVPREEWPVALSSAFQSILAEIQAVSAKGTYKETRELISWNRILAFATIFLAIATFILAIAVVFKP